MTDRAGQPVANEQDWHRSRNQQRNWETLIQLLSLRTQPMQLGDPTVDQVIPGEDFGSHYRGPQRMWTFDFAVESPMIFHANGDEVALLRGDSEQVPMIMGLTETAPDMPTYITQDPVYRNLVFRCLDR